MMPKVLNRRTLTKDPPNSVYIGRPSKWGNPFIIGGLYKGRTMTREDVVLAYEDWLYNSDEGFKILEDIDDLRGKDLICWCTPEACHGDILLGIANNVEDH